MSNSNHEIDLIIKAQLDGKNTLTDVSKSISAIEKALDKQTSASKRGKTAIADFKNEFAQLKSKLSDQLFNITQFQKLTDQLAKQEERLASTKKAFTELQTKIESTGTATERQTERLNRLATTASRTEASIAKNRIQYTNLSAVLTKTGVDLNNIAVAEAGVRNETERLAKAMRTSTDAVNKYGVATKSAANATDIFKSSGRTTLSMVQRYKGELLSLAASYVGLNAVLGLGGSAIDAYSAKLGIQSQLTLTSGSDARAVAEDYIYAQDQAKRLSVDFVSFANGYAKFLASGKFSGQGKDTLRFIFESFTEVGKVAQITQENLDGVFNALGQILSKGKIQAEELRGQLGDRIFGAFGTAAEALKAKFPDFDEALKKGLVGSEYLVNIAKVYKEQVAPGLGQSLDTVASKQALLNNAIFDFRVAIAESGFSDTYRELIKGFTEFLKGKEGIEFAKNLGKAFSALGDIALWLLKHLDEIKLILELIVIGKIVSGLFRIITGFGKLRETLIATRGAFALLSTSAKGLLLLFGTFGAIIAGVTIGSYFYNQVPEFKQFVDEIVFGFERMINKALEFLNIKFRVNFFDDLTRKTLENTKAIEAKTQIAAENDEKIKLLEKRLESGVMKTPAKGNFGSSAKVMSDTDKALARAEIKVLSIEYNKLKLDIQRLSNENKDIASGEFGKQKTNTDSPTATPQPVIATVTPTDDPEALAKKQAKYQTLKDNIDSLLNTIESSVAKKEADTIDEKIAQVELQYKNAQAKINGLNGKDKADATARLEKAKAALIADIISDNNKKLVAKQIELENDLASVQADAAKKEKLSLDARLAAVEAAQADRFQVIAKFRSDLEAAGKDTKPADELRSGLDSATKELKVLETKKFYLDELNRFEAKANALVAERTSRIDTLNTLNKAGLITDNQLLTQSQDIVKELQPRIEELTSEAIAFAEANRNAFDPEAIAAFIAAMQGANNGYRDIKTQVITAKELAEQLASSGTNLFDSISNSIGGAIAGVNSWGDAIKAIRNEFIQFAADFLRQTALMIVKAQLLSLLQSSTGTGGFLGTIADAASAMVKHEGGVVNGIGSRSRSVDPSMFVGAPRYHTGGIAGLAPDEYPAILQRNEEVLRTNDPRNVLNGGLGATSTGGQASSPQNIKIINQIDSASVISQGLGTDAGTKAIYNFMRANRSEMKSILG